MQNKFSSPLPMERKGRTSVPHFWFNQGNSQIHLWEKKDTNLMLLHNKPTIGCFQFSCDKQSCIFVYLLFYFVGENFLEFLGQSINLDYCCKTALQKACTKGIVDNSAHNSIFTFIVQFCFAIMKFLM